MCFLGLVSFSQPKPKIYSALRWTKADTSVNLGSFNWWPDLLWQPWSMPQAGGLVGFSWEKGVERSKATKATEVLLGQNWVLWPISRDFFHENEHGNWKCIFRRFHLSCSGVLMWFLATSHVAHLSHWRGKSATVVGKPMLGPCEKSGGKGEVVYPRWWFWYSLVN